MTKLAQFIVNKRLVLFFVFIIFAAYCVYGITKVEVEYEIAKYLPSGTDTSRAISIMESEFAPQGNAAIMVRGIEKQNAESLAAELRSLAGVAMLSFDPSSNTNYTDGNALYSVFFSGGSNDGNSVAAYNEIIKLLDDGGYDYCVPTPLVDNFAQKLASEMIVIVAISAVVILIVLLFTSKSFAEVLAFPAVFAIAALLNMGTNYWLGKISFVSYTVCIILQLALAIDYAIILCHRFTEEKDKNPADAKAALVVALSKSIPEIASSSLTTVSGLVALMFMQLGLGFDLGMVLAKSIICSLLTVFFLMPCLLLWLNKPMDKTRHKSFVPKVRMIGVGVVKIRYAIAAGFAVLFGVCAWLSQNITYCYSQNSIKSSRPTQTALAQAEADSVFGSSNTFVILVPKSTDAVVQRNIMSAVSSDPLITSALGWVSVTLPSRSDPGKSYYLTDEIDCTELSDITGIDEQKAVSLFTLYALYHGGFGDARDVYEYRVNAGELFLYAFSNDSIMSDAGEDILKNKAVLQFGRTQLIGKNHYRMVFNIDASVEDEKTFALIERLTPIVKDMDENAIFAGASMSAYDLNGSFKYDNILITLLTVIFVFVILAVTFKSWGIPIVLVSVIQGAIFMNFSLPVLIGGNMFFFVYLIACAIQMGATIDYAILMTNRYRHNIVGGDGKSAVAEAISGSFPTIMTSGTIMTVAAFLVGFMTSNPLIASMGVMLATGTLISIACVIFVLPALLYMFGPLLEKTVFARKTQKGF